MLFQEKSGIPDEMSVYTKTDFRLTCDTISVVRLKLCHTVFNFRVNDDFIPHVITNHFAPWLEHYVDNVLRFCYQFSAKKIGDKNDESKMSKMLIFPSIIFATISVKSKTLTSHAGIDDLKI
jgi:hypothetical protein